jgi:HNH endonuclease
MPMCLFCRHEFEKLTDEHVFQAAIGGKLVVKDATCEECNHGISKQYEQEIAGRFVHFRRILDIKDRRGKTPTIEITLNIDGQERLAALYGDGQVVLCPRVTETVHEGVVETVYENLPESAKENLRKKAKEEGIELIEEWKPGGEVEASFSGGLDFLTSEGMVRFVAKIAYTALALRMGVAVAHSDSFNEIREFINAGGRGSLVRLFLNDEFLTQSAHGLHQHSVVLAGRNDKRSVDAVVRLFGGLSYMVNLSTQYRGADFFDTLVYDAQRGEINKALATHLQSEIVQIETLQADKNTIWDDQQKSGEWFLNFVENEIRRSTHATS